jgi:hypothetical protein
MKRVRSRFALAFVFISAATLVLARNKWVVVGFIDSRSPSIVGNISKALRRHHFPYQFSRQGRFVEVFGLVKEQRHCRDFLYQESRHGYPISIAALD